MDPVRKWVLIYSGLCVLLFLWYLLGDRFTPFTTQARVNAFVVPIAPQVSGELLAVEVTNNQRVAKGQLLARIDPERYELAVASAEAQLELTRLNLQSLSAAVDAAEAALSAAKAALVKEKRSEERLRRINAEDSGAVSQRLIEWSEASFKEARANVAAAEADLEKAVEQLGPRGDNNPQLIAARSALDRARLDLGYTRVVAPADGLVTDLRANVGDYAQTGQPVMTFIAIHDVWVQADLTENNIGRVQPGDSAEMVLDVLPGTVLKGRVRSITYGVQANESVSTPGALPTVQNTRDWLRDAQRFPVLIDFADLDEEVQSRLRVGGQANVIVYAGGNPLLNLMGRIVIRLSGWLSHVY